MSTIVNKLQSMWANMNPCKLSAEFTKLLDEADKLADTANAEDLKLFEEFQDRMQADTFEFAIDNYC